MANRSTPELLAPVGRQVGAQVEGVHGAAAHNEIEKHINLVLGFTNARITMSAQVEGVHSAAALGGKNRHMNLQHSEQSQ